MKNIAIWLKTTLHEHEKDESSQKTCVSLKLGTCIAMLLEAHKG